MQMTHILVLLINKLPTTPNHYIYLKLDKSNREVNLISLTAAISSSKRDNIFLAPAMSSCDITSGIFGIGKTKLFYKQYSRGKS